MKVPEIIPPNDLLKQIEGIETGLRRRKRLGNVGAIGAVLAATLQAVATVANSKWWQDLTGTQVPKVLQQWPYLVGLGAIVFFFILFSWSRFWLKESQAAFRYSCSIAEFEPVRPGPKGDDPPWLTGELRERLSCLSHDLAERISQRVTRIRFKDKPGEPAAGAKPGEGERQESHIHIRGVYVVRKDRDEDWVLEIMPRVRIGPLDSSEALAHPVVYRLGKDSFCDPASKRPLPAPIRRDQYERIQERLYFSVATVIYKQIQEDVVRKIELLPTDYFRALAYFYEAEDYSRSNTLDAYKEANDLYRKSIDLFDPRLKPLPSSPALRRLEQLNRWVFKIRWNARGLITLLRPRYGQTQLMCARAEIGYANMLLYRRILASLSGQRLNPIFEARPIAADAVRRLESLPADAPGRCESLFDAYVTMALAMSSLDAVQEPRRWLGQAERLDPIRSEENSRYLFVSSRTQPKLTSRMNLLRRAIALESRFEVAQWSMAVTLETLWRIQPTFEGNVAEAVLREYEEVLKINPGNVSAWASRGYIRWLLRHEQAKEEFESGMEYKSMRPQTFVSALDYGLARIAAERGDLVTAYQHYVDAVSAQLAEGVFHEDGNSNYFNQIGNQMLQRIEEYQRGVQNAVGAAERDAAATTSARVRNSVRAFALNDYGEACYYYYLRRGDLDLLKRAREMFQDAAKMNPQYVIPPYNLSSTDLQLAGQEADEAKQDDLFREAVDQIKKANEIEPDWPDVTLTKASLYGEWAKHLRQRAKRTREEAARMREDLQKNKSRAQELRAAAKSKEAEAEKKEQEAKRQYSEPQGRVPAAARAPEVAAPPPTATTPVSTAASRTPTPALPVPAATPPHSTTAPPFPTGAGPVEIRRTDVPLVEENQKNAPIGPRMQGRLEASNPEIEARRLRAEAGKLSAEADKLDSAADVESMEDKIKALEGDAADRAVHATASAEPLLPQPWLWVQTNDGGIGFNWMALDQEDYRTERKWERELNDLHAKALRTWAIARQATIEGGAEDGAADERRRQTSENQKKLILCLREHFFPSNFNLIEAARELSSGYSRDIQDVIENWVSENPADYWALTWLTDRAFSEQGPHGEFAKSTLKKALEQTNVSAHTCYWIGTESQARKDDLALEAYRRVVDLSPSTALLARTGDRLEDLEAWKDAQACYESALAKTLKPEPGERIDVSSVDQYRILRGKMLWKQQQCGEAIGEFEQVTGDPEKPWISALVRELLRSPDLEGSHRLIKSWLERKALACRQRGDEKAGRDVHEAILRFARSTIAPRTDSPQHAPKSAGMLAVVTPVAVEADSGLFPGGDDWTTTHPLFTRYIPELRQRLQDEMGVSVPGIRFRANEGDLPRDSYIVMLQEIPLVMGSVERNRMFCPDEGRLREAAGKALEGKAAVNPKTPGQEGVWLAKEDWPVADNAGLPLWDYFEFMLMHVEAVLRANLGVFLGMQEIENMLETWRNQADQAVAADRRRLAAQVLPDVRCKLRFGRLLQALVAEGVPVTDLGTILETLRRTPTGDGPDLLPWVEAVRLSLRDRLPGNHADSPFFWLSGQFEEEILNGIEQRNGTGDLLSTKALFSLAPESAQELLASVRSATGEVRGPAVIVTRAAGIRPFVRRLIQLEFPQISTLSLSELHGHLRESVQRTIEL